ncbi:MAG TPA: hypothetical protein VGE98_15395 [Thermoanaerobaculia bacterium]
MRLPLQLSPEERARHEALSPVQVRFLDHVAGHAEWSAPETFASIGAIDDYLPYVPQPWPLFLDSRRYAEMGRAASEVCRLVQQLPVRLFENDPRRLAEFYGLTDDASRFLSELIATTDCLPSTVGRGDFLGAPDALKCCEMNMAANLGGFQIISWEERYLALPPVSRFLAAERLRGRMIVPTLCLFSHLIDDVLRHGLAAGGVVNTAVVVAGAPSQVQQDYLDRHFRAVLAAKGGLEGGLRLCQASDLREQKGELSLAGWPVHAIIDFVMGQLGRDAYVAQLAGSVRAFNGPLTHLLSDKLNLALLSETADTGLWSAEERAAIHRIVPWSRRVAADFTEFQGERAYLPDLLLDERERMVLKLGMSMGGKGVHVGRATEPERWAALAEQALNEPGWMVQERVDTPTYVFLSPEGEAMEHEVVWGFFAIGDEFSGGFLRMTPVGRAESGVINGSLFGGRGGPIIAVEPA